MTVTRTTSKGQVTIPIEVRRALGIQPGDLVSIRLDGRGAAVIEPQKGWAERTAGMFKGYRAGPPLSAEELREAYEVGVAEQVMESMAE